VSATQQGPLTDAGSIPELAFAVREAAPLQYAAVPTLRFGLGIESVGGRPVRSILLDVQIQINARRRGYDPAVRERLFELFGAPEGWSTSLRTLLWTRTTVVVPPFNESTTVDVAVPCTYDLEVAASRYFDALADGDVPLEFLFSGSVFYTPASGLLQTARLSWNYDADYRLPVRVWKETMERHFPGSAWVRLSRDSFDRLAAYKARHALPTWEHALDALLPEDEEG
jgi:uncharacterized protein DUF6084